MYQTSAATAARRADAALAELELPDGRRVLCPSRHSAALLWNEISGQGLYGRAVEGLPPGATILDVGANVGLASIFFSDRVLGTRIFALEPAEACFACLRTNVARHAPTVVPLQVAAGAAIGDREFVYYPNAPEHSTLQPDPDDEWHTTATVLAHTGMARRMRESFMAAMFVAQATTVPVRTIASLLDEYAIDTVQLVKVDVERGEQEVLEGIGAANWPRIERLVIEVHDIAGRLGCIAAQLAGGGYRVIVEQAEFFASTNIYGILAVRG